MKKSALIFSMVSVILFSGAAFAEDQDIEGMDMPMMEEMEQGGGPMMDRQEMMGGKGKKGMMGGKKGMMGMMGMMHQKSTMVVTSDGGVLVLSGSKLAKYDANLNLVKEIEIKGGGGHDQEAKDKRKGIPGDPEDPHAHGEEAAPAVDAPQEAAEAR